MVKLTASRRAWSLVSEEKNGLVFHSATAKNAAELADTAAMFVVVRAKSNLEIPNARETCQADRWWVIQHAHLSCHGNLGLGRI